MKSSILKKGQLLTKSVSGIALVVLMMIFCRCGDPDKTSDPPFLHGLDIKGFEQKGPLLIYNRNSIFEYMNGEAENYLPNGFTLLYAGTFLVQGRDAQLLMEAYDMASPKGAVAVFQIYAKPPGREYRDIGETAWKSASRWVFHRGPYFIRITSDPAAGLDFHPTPSELEVLAREVDRVLLK